MEGYLTYYYEYHFLYISGIDHVEIKSIQGTLMKLTFHEGTDMSQAMSETIGYVNRAGAFMPPGTVPPFVTRWDAGSVAVGQLVFESTAHTQGELQDFALNRVRPLFATHSLRCRAFPRRPRLEATSGLSSSRSIPRSCTSIKSRPMPAVDALRSRRVRAVLLYGWRRPPAICAALARGCLLDDRFLRSFQHHRSGLFHVAVEESRA